MVRLHNVHSHRSSARVPVFRRTADEGFLGDFDSRPTRRESFFEWPADHGDRRAGWRPNWIRFAATAPLPSELVAFAVGPFDVYPARSPGATPMRVITPKGHGADGKAAAEAAVNLLPKLEAYTGIPYPFAKLDHLALADAGFAAVENPGLIVYLAKELLIAPGTENRENTRAVRFLEAHEMGHQWFGDMVTQADWNDVWLSEAFATWISEKMMDQEEVAARAHLSAIATRERIMGVDASAKTHPVRVDVNSREDSLSIYNRVAYDKGASVLLMLEGWLGEEKFRDALRSYLRDHRYGNASTRDLGDELKRAPWEPTPRLCCTASWIPREFLAGPWPDCVRSFR